MIRDRLEGSPELISRLRSTTLTMKRRMVQSTALIALHSSWGPELKWFCNPVLSCHSCVLAWFACPVGVLVHYAGLHVFPVLALGMILLLGALLGRLLCGWVCPFGFLQDMLYKLPTRKFHLPAWTSNIKYGVFAVMVLFLPFMLGSETLLSFCRFCPASALQVTIPNLLTGGVATVSTVTVIKLGILVMILALVIGSSRAFCRVLCPIGAMLAPLNYVALWKIRVPTQSCLDCKACREACPTQGMPAARIKQGVAPNRTLDCIVCHECQAACPTAEITARRAASQRRKQKTHETAAAHEIMSE
jgi:ferredoxin-type protein NapH